MDTIRRLLTFLLVLICGICVVIWAGWFNGNLDFLGWGYLYAVKFPMGPMIGPLAVGFGSLLVAYFIYPGSTEGKGR